MNPRRSQWAWGGIDVNRAIRLGRRLIRLLACLLLAGASAKALAGSADLEGTLAYRIDGDRITVEIERIANNTSDTTTGTLYVTVWMTVDSNLHTRGYRVARHQITGSSNGTLRPGQYFSDLRWTLAYQAPPPGTYYVHFYTSEHPETNTVLDSHTFTSTVEVGESGGPADIEGRIAYNIDDDRITVEIDRIVNNSDTTTGTLYVTVWLTVDRNFYTRGHRVARHRITGNSNGTLRPGQYFSDLRWTLDYEAPPRGTYYVHYYTSQHPEPDTVLDSRTFLTTLDVGGGSEDDDHGNSRSSATRIALPSVTSGVINRGNDTDYFRFAVSARGTVVMESSGGLDTIGTLFDARGSRIVQNDDGAGYPNFRIERTLDAGTYYVRVHSYGTATGGYTLHLHTGDGGGGDDHGNSRSAATRVALPSTTSGVIDPGNDTDYFRFVVSARGAVVMESDGSLDTIGTLFDARGSRIVQDDDGAGYPNFRIERTLDAGTYYVRVHSYQTATGSYTLNLRTGDGGGGGGDDHGNSRSAATLITLPSTTTGVIDPGNDTDYFRFAVSARGAVVMESDGSLDTIGTLFDARGSRIVQDDDGAGYPNFRIERTLDAGTYYVRVHSYQTATGGYTLRLRAGDGSGGGGGDDHGNSRSSATRIALPSTTTGTIDPGNDTDYFRFVVSARQTVVMESSGDLDAIGTLFDARGARIVQDDDGAGYPNFRIERTLDAGTYYIRVHSFARTTGDYTLHLRIGGNSGPAISNDANPPSR